MKLLEQLGIEYKEWEQVDDLGIMAMEVTFDGQHYQFCEVDLEFLTVKFGRNDVIIFTYDLKLLLATQDGH